MKKIFAILVMAMFLFSIVPVFADNTETETVGEQIDIYRLGDDEIPNTSGMGDIHVRGVSVTDLRSMNLLEKKKAEAIRERFLVARAKLLEAKKAFVDDREDLRVKLKGAKDTCVVNEESAECMDAKEGAVEASRKYILHAIDVIENLLEKRKAKLEEMIAKYEASDAENTGSMVQKLEARLENVNARLSALAELRAEAEAAQTREEIKQLARKLRESWREIKPEVEEAGSYVLATRFSFVIEKSESLKKRLDNLLSRLEAEGVDTSSAEADVEIFNQHIEKAGLLVEQAKAKFAEAKEGQTSVKVKEGYQLLVEAHSELKLAHGVLKKIVAELKALGAQAELESEAGSDADEQESAEEIAETSVDNTETQSEANEETEVSADAEAAV